MIDVLVKYEYKDNVSRCILKLDVNSFSDICEENMSLECSDNLIKHVLFSNYGIEKEFISNIHVMPDGEFMPYDEITEWIDIKKDVLDFKNKI